MNVHVQALYFIFDFICRFREDIRSWHFPFSLNLYIIWLYDFKLFDVQFIFKRYIIASLNLYKVSFLNQWTTTQPTSQLTKGPNTVHRTDPDCGFLRIRIWLILLSDDSFKCNLFMRNQICQILLKEIHYYKPLRKIIAKCTIGPRI